MRITSCNFNNSHGHKWPTFVQSFHISELSKNLKKRIKTFGLFDRALRLLEQYVSFLAKSCQFNFHKKYQNSFRL